VVHEFRIAYNGYLGWIVARALSKVLRPRNKFYAKYIH
jgi:hypothetical protein